MQFASLGWLWIEKGKYFKMENEDFPMVENFHLTELNHVGSDMIRIISVLKWIILH